jgi:hypothetical protein
VKLYRRLSLLFYNSFNPIFVGHFSQRDNETTLAGIFRMHWYTVGFLVVFFGMIGYNIVDTMLQPENRPGYVEGWKEAELKWNIEFLFMALLVPIAGWLFGLPSRNAILRAIQKSI